MPTFYGLLRILPSSQIHHLTHKRLAKMSSIFNYNKPIRKLSPLRLAIRTAGSNNVTTLQRTL